MGGIWLRLARESGRGMGVLSGRNWLGEGVWLGLVWRDWLGWWMMPDWDWPGGSMGKGCLLEALARGSEWVQPA